MEAAAPAAGAAGTTAPAAPASVIDSILPIAEEIRRFRAIAPETPAGLEGGERSRDALVRRWVRAVERADTVAIRTMLISPTEFITFYYPASKFSRAPYQQSPGLLWFLMSSNSSQGATRVLQRHGGQSFGFVSFACGDTTETVGELRVWSDCRVRRSAGGQDTEMRFFGGIVEQDGVYKFLSYASDY